MPKNLFKYLNLSQNEYGYDDPIRGKWGNAWIHPYDRDIRMEVSAREYSTTKLKEPECSKLETQHNNMCGIHSINNGWDICIRSLTVEKFLNEYIQKNWNNIKIQRLWHMINRNIMPDSFKRAGWTEEEFMTQMIGMPDIEVLKYILDKVLPHNSHQRFTMSDNSFFSRIMYTGDKTKKESEKLFTRLKDCTQILMMVNVMLFYEDPIVKQMIRTPILDFPYSFRNNKLKIIGKMFTNITKLHYIVFKRNNDDDPSWCLLDSNGVYGYASVDNLLYCIKKHGVQVLLEFEDTTQYEGRARLYPPEGLIWNPRLMRFVVKDYALGPDYDNKKNLFGLTVKQKRKHTRRKSRRRSRRTEGSTRRRTRRTRIKKSRSRQRKR